MENQIVFEGQYFYYRHSESTPASEKFQLHTHNHIEMLIFLKGDAEYIVESSIYPLQPYDILLTKTNEMHQIRHRSNADYERVVVAVPDSFFSKCNCEPYKGLFVKRALGAGNRIRLSAADKPQLKNLLARIEQYIDDAKTYNSDTIVYCAMVELLHFLNHVHKHADSAYTQNLNVNKILNFINEQITTDLKLDDIARYMFMSKYHLCRIFKKHTGLTVNQYIAHKRILLVREYYMRGVNLSQASVAAGFTSYCSFYKTYCNLTGKAPKHDIAQYQIGDQYRKYE